MAVWGANPLQKHMGRLSASSGLRRPVPVGPGWILQWAVVGLAGLVLGIFLTQASSLPQQWVPLSVLAVLLAFIAMIVRNLRRLLLAIIVLDIPLQLDTHLFYRAEVADLGGIPGLGITATTVSLIALYVLWFGELTTRSTHRSRLMFRACLPPALYLLFALLSMVAARDVLLSLFEIVLLFHMFLLYVYLVAFIRSERDVLFIVTTLLIGLFIESLIIIGVYVTGYDLSFAGIGTRVDPSYTTGQFFRPGGTIGSPVVAAGYLSLLLAPAISLQLTRLGRGYKWLGTLAFGFGVLALILTFTRGGWVAFAVSVGLLCLLAWQRGWLPLRVPLAIGVLGGLVGFLFYAAVSTRIFGDDLGSAFSRIPLMKLALRMIADSPVLGIGANNFSLMIDQYARAGFAGVWVYTVHNKYLLVWAETGIGGLVAFMWFLVATIRRGWHTWRTGNSLLSPLSLGFTAAIVGQIVHMGVDSFNDRAAVQLFWLIAGVIAAMRNTVGKS